MRFYCGQQGAFFISESCGHHRTCAYALLDCFFRLFVGFTHGQGGPQRVTDGGFSTLDQGCGQPTKKKKKKHRLYEAIHGMHVFISLLFSLPSFTIDDHQSMFNIAAFPRSKSKRKSLKTH